MLASHRSPACCCSPRSSPGSCARRSRCCRCASSARAASRATNGVSFAMFFGTFGSIFLLAQFFQTRAGLLAARGRPAHAAVDGDADARRADRRDPVGPHRLAAADGRRAGAAGGRDGAGWRSVVDARRRLRAARRAVRDGGRRHGARVRAGRERGARARCARRRPARRRARRTRSARSAARSASRCSSTVFAGAGSYASPQAFTDGMTRACGSAPPCSRPARSSRCSSPAAARQAEMAAAEPRGGRDRHPAAREPEPQPLAA